MPSAPSPSASGSQGAMQQFHSNKIVNTNKINLKADEAFTFNSFNFLLFNIASMIRNLGKASNPEEQRTKKEEQR